MGKCATKKTVRRFADGGSATDIAGMLAGTNIYANGAGTTTGISGATHLTSTNASTAVPVPGQQAIGQMQSATGIPKPATQSRRDSSPLGKLDQDIAMGNAMGQMSNTERYQMANPGNQPYTIGQPQGRGRGEQPGMVSSAPGSSADASMLNQKTSLMSSLRGKLAEQPLYAGYANGGVVDRIRDALSGEKAPPPPPPPPSTTIAIRGHSDESGYANGGKIKGPGTATSDSIQAKVTDTGEPIAVSTGERIVSKAQDALLQKIAAGMGYESLDAMLEAGTGKPVGPTIKGGMAHAFNGADITTDLIAKKPFQETRDVYNAARSDYDNANSVGAKIHHATKGTLAMLPAVYSDIASDIGRAVKPAVTPLITGEDSPVVAPQAQAPTPVKPSPTPAIPATSAPSNAVQDPGYNHGAPMPEQNFTANDKQIAKPSGAIQGKSSVDATQMSAPQGGGYITNRAGEAMMLEPQAIAAKAPNAQIDANGNNMAYTNQMKEQLVGMQRDRLMRDMGSDITSQGTRVAAHQQLAQMDKDQGMAMLAHRSQRDDATAGMDQQLKGQQIAQLSQDADLKTKVMAGDPAAIEMWNRIHPKDQEEFGAVALKETDANGLVSERLAPYSKRTGLAPSGVAQPKSDPRAEARAALATGKITKEEVNKRLVAAGHQPI